MKHNYRQTFLIGFAFFSICAFWQIYESIIPLMLKNDFGLREVLTNAVMAIDNVLALFLLPLFGFLSDRTNTRFGKRTPYIVLGTIFSVIFMLLLPIASSQRNLLFFFTVLGLVLISMGTYRSPAVSLMPDLTPKRHRSNANAIINLIGTFGGIYTLAMIKFLTPKNVKNPNYTKIFVAVAVIMVVSIVILMLTINEKKLSEKIKKEDSDFAEETETAKDISEPMPAPVKRSFFLILASVFLWFCAYNAVTTAFSRYAEEVWDMTGGEFTTPLMIATGAAFVSYIPLGFLSSRIGRKKTILGGIVLMFVAFSLASFISEVSLAVYIVFIITGIGWAAINVNSYPMVVEISKASNIGKYTGYYYTFSMAAQIFTPLLSGVFLEINYRTLFPYAAIFMIFAFSTFILVKHGDSRPIKKENLIENFDIED